MWSSEEGGKGGRKGGKEGRREGGKEVEREEEREGRTKGAKPTLKKWRRGKGTMFTESCSGRMQNGRGKR